MDRLEEIKVKYRGKLNKQKAKDNRITCKLMDTCDYDWLISEIEQLKKKKEWLINIVICSDYSRYGHLFEKESKKLLIKEMQQVLKEK